MSSGCGDVLSLADLQTAKKHQLFEAEVITGKQGGVASGADIDYATNQVTGQTQKTLPAVLRDAGFRPASFTFATGGTLGVNDADLAVLWPGPSGDGQYYSWHGALPKTIPAGSSPATTGGVSDTAWKPIYDASLRTDLAGGNGTMIGTSHRGNLLLDLNSIDRRPDGYTGGVSSVLANGRDVEIDKDITLSSRIAPTVNQVIEGRGGLVTISNPTSAAVFIDARSTSTNTDKVQLRNVKMQGSVVDTGGAAYGVFLRDVSDPVIDGMYSSGFTGGVININTTSSFIKGVRATNTIYHPALVAGGYGVLLDESRQAIIDGVQFDAGSGSNGRHMLYVSRSGNNSNAYDGCQNTLAVNMVAKYRNKDDRNFWGINVRKSTRTLMGNFIIEGANGGVAYNVENGFIEKNMTFNASISVLKYQNGVGVYGVSQTSDASTNKVTGFLDTGLVLEVKPKDATITGADCIGYSIAGTNGRLSNVVTNVSTAGNPILVQPGTNNVMIDGVMDYTSDNSADPLAAMITFTGTAASCSNITVRGIRTSRAMFARLSAVTDLTVDFQRKARVTTNGSGGTTLVDSQSIIGTVVLSSTAVTVNFPTHVTQNAVENVFVNGTAGAFQVFVTSYGAKSITIALYTPAGVLINPQTTAATFNVILSS